jgi:hypothetical protein
MGSRKSSTVVEHDYEAVRHSGDTEAGRDREAEGEI